MDKNLDRSFIEENLYVAKKHMKISKSFIVKECKLKLQQNARIAKFKILAISMSSKLWSSLSPQVLVVGVENGITNSEYSLAFSYS